MRFWTSFGRAYQWAGRAAGGLLVHRFGAAVWAVIYTRAMQPDARGIYAIVNIVAQIAVYILLLGADVWANRGRQGAARAFVVRLRLLGIGTAVVVPVIWVWSAEAAVLTASGIFFSASMASFLLLSGVLAGQDRMRGWSILFAGRGALVVAFGLMVALLLEGPSPAAVNAIEGLSYLVCAALAYPAVRGTELASVKMRGDPNLSRFGVTVAAGFLVLFCLYRADAFLVGAIAGLAAVGTYTAATALSEALLIVPDAVNPALVRMAGGRVGPRKALVPALIGTLVGCGVLAATLIAVRHPLIELLYGPEYRQVADVLPVLLVASIVVSMWKTVCSFLLGHGNGKLRLQSAAGGLIVMVLVDMVLIPRFGLDGAAAGALIAYSFAILFLGLSLRTYEWPDATEPHDRDDG